MATTRKRAPTLSMAGLTPDAVRGFLLQAAESPNWTPAYAASVLGVEEKAVTGILAGLSMVGYIEPDPGDKKRWRTTAAGNAMAGVSKAKPVARKTAERSMQEALARIREVNLKKQYLYAVEKAVIFGSFSTGAEKIKNVDIALALRPKLADETKLKDAVKADAERATEEEGKRFKSYADRRAWGKNKVHAYIKGKARAIALHELTEAILAQPHDVIFEP